MPREQITEEIFWKLKKKKRKKKKEKLFSADLKNINHRNIPATSNFLT